MTKELKRLVADYQRAYLKHTAAEQEADAATRAAIVAEITRKASRIAEIDLCNEEQAAHSALMTYIEERA